MYTVFSNISMGIAAAFAAAGVICALIKKGRGGPVFEEWDKAPLWPALTVIFWLSGLALRLFRLPLLPAGMHVDEAGMAYDAWCLGNFGVDRFLNRLPVYLINYGSGQSALYAYLCALFMKLGGNNLWMIRLPALLSGCMTMICGTLIVKKAFGRTAGAAAAFLLAVCPYFIMASRMGFDCNLMLGFSTAAMYALLLAVEKKGALRFILAGVLAGATLYTYSLSWMVMPLFLAFAVLYFWRTRSLKLSELIAMGIPLFLLALPLLLFVAVNHFGLEQMRFLGLTIPKIPYFRTDHFSLENAADNLLLLKTLLTKDQYAFNALDDYYTLYLVSVPLVLCGALIGIGRLVNGIRRRLMDVSGVVTLWFLAQMICGLIIKDPDIYRLNGIYFSLLFLAALSLVSFTKALAGLHKAAAGAAAALVLLCYLVHGVCFTGFYFTKYEEEYPIQWFINDHIDDILVKLKDAPPEQEIYFDNFNCSVYAYDLLIREISPYDYNLENDMYTSEENLGHRHYYLPPEDQISGDAWYVVMDYSGYGELLEARGFQKEAYGYYAVYRSPTAYKSQEESTWKRNILLQEEQASSASFYQKNCWSREPG